MWNKFYKPHRRAVYRIKGIVLVNTELVDEYLEAFKED